MKRFPQTLHLTVAEEGTENEFLQVLDGGIFDVDEPGKVVAVYKLVMTGKVRIEKAFVGRGKR